MSRHLPRSLLALSVVCACTGEPGQRTEAQPALGADDPRLGAAAQHARRKGWELLDVDATRALGATRAPVDAHELAFPPLRLTLTTYDEDQPLDGLALDARLVPGGDSVLVLAADRTLWRWTPSHATRLDSDVVPGLAVSPDGLRVAYAKGALPELDVWEATLDRGPPRAVTSAEGPEHSPAYSSDGARLGWITYRPAGPAFVSGDRTIVPRVTTVPDGRRAPIWMDGWLLLHGSAGTAVVREGTGVPLLDLSGATDISSFGGAAVGGDDGRWRALDERGSR